MIKQGDCLEFIKELPADSVDCIISDLPYGVTNAPFDIKLDLPTMWEEFNRVTKRNAAVVLFAQQPFSAELVMSNRHATSNMFGRGIRNNAVAFSTPNTSRSAVAKIFLSFIKSRRRKIRE